MKTPMVLLHGWGVNSLIWQPVLDGLKTEFDLTSLDLPGYGNQINYAGEYTLPAIVDDVLARAPEQAVWVGWSLGGIVAMAAALDHPARISKLQLVATTPCFLNCPQWTLGVDIEPFEKIADQFDLDYAKAIRKFLLLQANTIDRSKINEAKSLVHHTSERLLTIPAPSRKTLRGGLSLLKETDLRPRLHELTVATQVVAGIHDHVVPLAASEFLANQLSNCQDFCRLNSGHLPFIEASGEYLGLLTSFMKSTQ